MIGGALLAAFFDLKFEVVGYLLILSNDFFTAAYGVSIKRALNFDIPQMRCVRHHSIVDFGGAFGGLFRVVAWTGRCADWFVGSPNFFFARNCACTCVRVGSIALVSDSVWCV